MRRESSHLPSQVACHVQYSWNDDQPLLWYLSMMVSRPSTEIPHTFVFIDILRIQFWGKFVKQNIKSPPLVEDGEIIAAVGVGGAAPAEHDNTVPTVSSLIFQAFPDSIRHSNIAHGVEDASQKQPMVSLCAGAGEGSMRVIVLPKGEEKEFPGRRRVADVLKALDVIPETVLVAKGTTLVTADETVEADAVLRIIPVISGGRSGEVCEVS
jgi:sulfur carrier protein ThiS